MSLSTLWPPFLPPFIHIQTALTASQLLCVQRKLILKLCRHCHRHQPPNLSGVKAGSKGQVTRKICVAVWLWPHPCCSLGAGVLRPFPPPTLHVRRQLGDVKGRAQSHLICRHHPRLPQCYRSVDVVPCPPEPLSCFPTPTPLSSNRQAPTNPAPSPALPPRPSIPPHPPSMPRSPDSACKSTPWMMDYCVTAACEGLICFIDFSLGRMPASAASHLFPKTCSCNRR